jgi:hypothetical protein
MRDPHVEALFYTLRHAENVLFLDPPPLYFDGEMFRASLDGGTLRVDMLQHYSSIREARDAVDPFVHAWELQEELLGTTRGIRFAFDSADVVDRSPPGPGASTVLDVHSSVHGHSVTTVTLQVNRTAYPLPPHEFVVTPDVETMWGRFSGYLEGREPLQAMCYFCLTVLETSAGDRRKAARFYNVDFALLKLLGDLSSNRGDVRSARKADAAETPLNDTEKHWLEAALRRLIGRVGEIAAGKHVDRLTMSDLPPVRAGSGLTKG